VKSAWHTLIAAGATTVGVQSVELHRILCGTPRYGVDIHEKKLPQETGQERALNFNKGCYIGQEIIERIHSRGIVHRVFTGFTFDRTPTPAAPGENIKLQHDGKDVGYLTSIATVPTSTGERVIALGYIRREAANAGTAITAGGA